MVAADPPTDPDSRNEALDLLVRSLIGPVLIGLTVCLILTRDWTSVPHTTAVQVSAEDISTEPVRHPLGDPPRIVIGGYEMHCMECHRHLDSRRETPRRLTQHRHIELDHGVNDRCLNCHDLEDRNKLALDGGRTIPFGEAATLCAQCHGTAWRDWQRGTHGRTNEYWDLTRGPVRRLVCIECHDPHAPAFPPMKPLPGPKTLRMGTPREGGHADEAGRRNPLLQWSIGQPRAHGPREEASSDAPHDQEAH
jgi:hypothetical protein